MALPSVQDRDVEERLFCSHRSLWGRRPHRSAVSSFLSRSNPRANAVRTNCNSCLLPTGSLRGKGSRIDFASAMGVSQSSRPRRVGDRANNGAETRAAPLRCCHRFCSTQVPRSLREASANSRRPFSPEGVYLRRSIHGSWAGRGRLKLPNRRWCLF